jgi:hypothetical protein
MAARITEERWIYRFETDAGRASRAGPEASPTCRLSVFRRRSGCVPAEPYPPLKQGQLQTFALATQAKVTFREEIPVLFAQTIPVLFAPRHH